MNNLFVFILCELLHLEVGSAMNGLILDGYLFNYFKQTKYDSDI